MFWESKLWNKCHNSWLWAYFLQNLSATSSKLTTIPPQKKKKTSSYSGPPLSSIASWLMNRMKNKIHVPNLVHPTQNRPPVYIPSCGSATVFPGVWPTTINLTPSSFRRRKTCDENSPTLNAMSHRGIQRINTYTLNLLNLLAFK